MSDESGEHFKKSPEEAAKIADLVKPREDPNALKGLTSGKSGPAFDKPSEKPPEFAPFKPLPRRK